MFLMPYIALLIAVSTLLLAAFGHIYLNRQHTKALNRMNNIALPSQGTRGKGIGIILPPNS